MVSTLRHILKNNQLQDTRFYMIVVSGRMCLWIASDVTSTTPTMTCKWLGGMWRGRGRVGCWRSRNGSRPTFPGSPVDRRHEISPSPIRNPISHFLETLTREPLLWKKWPKPYKKAVTKAGARNKNGLSSGKARRRCSLCILYNDRFLWSDP